MTDHEIIDYCMTQMEGIPYEKRTAQFQSVFALAIPGKEIKLFEGIVRGIIVEEPRMEFFHEHLPFEVLMYFPQWDMMLGEVLNLPARERLKHKTHREVGFDKVMKYLNNITV
jgi:XTP/dITP diphosphohydrolase